VHPPEETLLELACGEADLPQRVLLEGHLAGCAACRAAVGELARPGGELLRALPGVEPPPDRLWQRVRREIVEIEARRPGAAPGPLAELPLPEAARLELPGAAPPRWRSAWAPGARFAVLARDAHTGAFLVAAHMPPSRAFPLHEHLGAENVLVLAGGYEDHLGRYEAGEYAVYGAGSRHRPATEPGEECWILSRLEAPIRFLGWRGWLQKIF
jgi:putative transcriptional regulator